MAIHTGRLAFVCVLIGVYGLVSHSKLYILFYFLSCLCFSFSNGHSCTLHSIPIWGRRLGSLEQAGLALIVLAC